MSESELQLPLVRSLSRPYYLLRSPDGRGHYFARDIQRSLFGSKESLVRFLAKGVLDDTEKPSEIRYELPGPPESFLPMTHVPPDELKALEAAIASFYERSAAKTSGVTTFEKELRIGFRLPDPDLEPDAYWLYGPAHDQKLLIFGGCEFQPGTALPLAEHPRIHEAETVLEKLRSREMPADARMELALNLALDPKEVLSDHLLRSRTDPRGRVIGYSSGQRNYSLRDFKRAGSYPKKAIAEFEEAARLYYAAAYDSGGKPSEAEANLRKGIRLPDPAKHKDRYGLVKSPDGVQRLMAIAQPLVAPSDSLSLVDDPNLDLPPPREDGTVEPTVAERLWKKKSPVAVYASLAAVAMLALVGAAVYFFVLADKEPPTLVEVDAVDDPTQVVLRFSEAIDPASLFAAETSDDDEARQQDQRIVLRDAAGKRLPVRNRAVNEENTAEVILTVDPLAEDRYLVRVEAGLRDTSANRNATLDTVERSFDYRDTQPPTLLQVSADGEVGRRVILIFDEPLDPTSAARLNLYNIQGAELISAQPLAEAERVVLEAEEAFVDGERYALTLYGLQDASLMRNARREPTVHEFTYTDILPPELISVEARRVQNQVDLVFTERLDEAVAQSPTRYRIVDLDNGEEVAVEEAMLLEDGKTVVLRTTVLGNGRRYGLTVNRIADQAPEANELTVTEPVEFFYTGRPDMEGPQLQAARALPNGLRLLIRFSEAVDRVRATTVSAYELSPYVPIEAAEPTTVGDRDFTLRLGEPLDNDTAYTLTVTEMADSLGNLSEETRWAEIRRPGVRTIGSVDVLGFRSVSSNTDGTVVEIEYTSAVVAEQVTDRSRYTISDGIRIESIEVDAANPALVRLNLATPLQAQSYTIEATELGLANDPAQVQQRVTGTVSGPGFLGW